jgi:hypothetical protein
MVVSHDEEDVGAFVHDWRFTLRWPSWPCFASCFTNALDFQKQQ